MAPASSNAKRVTAASNRPVQKNFARRRLKRQNGLAQENRHVKTISGALCFARHVLFVY